MSPVGAEAGRGGWWYSASVPPLRQPCTFPGAMVSIAPWHAGRYSLSFMLRRRNIRSFGSELATAPSVTLTVLLIQRVGFGPGALGSI